MFKGLTPSRETCLEITDRVLGEMAQVQRGRGPGERYSRGRWQGLGKGQVRSRKESHRNGCCSCQSREGAGRREAGHARRWSALSDSQQQWGKVTVLQRPEKQNKKG